MTLTLTAPGEVHRLIPARLSWRWVVGLAALHAALFWASFHPVAAFPLAWVAFTPFALIVARGTARQALAGGFLATAAGGGATVYWLTLFGPEAWAGTAIGFGLYGLLMAALARPLSRRLPAALWLPLVVCAQEYLRGHLFFCSFPWVFLGHSQHAIGPLIQSADLGGAILISFVVAAASGVLADLLLGEPRRAVARRGAAVLGAALALCAYGALRERSIEVLGPGPKVLAVQANVPQDLKDSGPAPDLIAINMRISEKGLEEAMRAGERPDLIVWPETMVPVEWHYRGDRGWRYHPTLKYAALDLSPLARAPLAALAARSGAHVLAGSLHAEVRLMELVEHNSAFLIAPDGSVAGRYDKMYPAPMSEYTPFHDAWPALYRTLRRTFVPPGFSQFTPGRDVPVWEIGGFKIAASVCFDVTFPAATSLAVRNGADAIVNVSNYGWFKDSAELDLARVQTIFRAIETRRGIVAACNGGISSFVDPRGRAEDVEVVDPETGERRRKLVEGTLTRPLTTSRARTFVVALGEWPGYLSAIAALALAPLLAFRKPKQAEAPAP